MKLYVVSETTPTYVNICFVTRNHKRAVEVVEELFNNEVSQNYVDKNKSIFDIENNNIVVEYKEPDFNGNPLRIYYQIDEIADEEYLEELSWKR